MMQIRQANSGQESEPRNRGQGEKESPRGGVRMRKRSPRSKGGGKEEARRKEEGALRTKQNLNQGVREKLDGLFASFHGFVKAVRWF